MKRFAWFIAVMLPVGTIAGFAFGVKFAMALPHVPTPVVVHETQFVCPALYYINENGLKVFEQ